MRCKFESQSENINDDKKTIVYVDMEEAGNIIAFAVISADLWNKRGPSEKVPATNPRKPAVASEQCLSHTKVLVRKEKDAMFEGLKLVVKLKTRNLDKHSKNNGIAGMHHFRFDK